MLWAYHPKFAARHRVNCSFDKRFRRKRCEKRRKSFGCDIFVNKKVLITVKQTPPGIAARCQIPLFVTYGDIFPRPGEVGPLGGAGTPAAPRFRRKRRCIYRFLFTTPSVKIAFGAARRPRQTRNKNNPSAENIQSVSGGYSKSFFLRKRAGGNAIVGTFDDSNKKSP